MNKGSAILAGLGKAVIARKKPETVKFAKEALSTGVNPLDAIENGLIRCMTVVGDKYVPHEFFMPPMLLAADSMYAALDIILPHIPKEGC